MDYLYPPATIRRQLGACWPWSSSSSACVLWAFRPGSRQVHRDTANIPFRHEDTPAPDSRCEGGRVNEQETDQAAIPKPPAIAGTGSRNSTTRCRAGGSGPSTRRSSGAFSIRIAYPAWPLINGATRGFPRLLDPRRGGGDIQTLRRRQCGDRGEARGRRSHDAFALIPSLQSYRPQCRGGRLPHQLLAMPRLGCGGGQGLSEPAGR